MKEARKITKAKILQELDRLPDEVLVKVWEYAKSIDTKLEVESVSPENQICEDIAEINRRSRVRQAYLASKKERGEVYRRLANS